MPLPLGVVGTPPAHAAGENCKSNKLAERCADITGQDGSISPTAGISSKKGRVKVRVVSVSLQYRMDVGWVNNGITEPKKRWVHGGHSTSASTSCDGAADGKWRSKAVAQWKLGRDGEVHTGRVISDPISRDRLCG